VRACVRVCVRVCVCGCACKYVSLFTHSYCTSSSVKEAGDVLYISWWPSISSMNSLNRANTCHIIPHSGLYRLTGVKAFANDSWVASAFSGSWPSGCVNRASLLSTTAVTLTAVSKAAVLSWLCLSNNRAEVLSWADYILFRIAVF